MVGQLTSAEEIEAYMYAGKARLTFFNPETGRRFTYRVVRPPDQWNPNNPVHFVQVLQGPNNEEDYEFIGTVFSQRLFRPARRANPEWPCVKAFAWVFNRMRTGRALAPVKVYHEGACGACGRTLTVPESVTSGLGPECRAARERRR